MTAFKTLRATLAIALLAAACTAQEPAPRGDAGPPAPSQRPLEQPAGKNVGLLLRSLEPVTERVRDAVRNDEGVIASSFAPVFVVELETIDGVRAPPRDAKSVLPVVTVAVAPDALERLPSGKDAASVLREGEAVVHETTAALLGLAVGSRIRVSRSGSMSTFRIGSISRGDDFFRYELMVPLSSPIADLPAHAMLVAAREGSLQTIAAAAKRAAGEELIAIAPLGPREGIESTLAFAPIKELFGQFWFRRGSSDIFHPDPAWVRDAIERTHLPVVGEIACHRKIVRQMSYAMREIDRQGLAPLVRSYDGCYVPRLQRTATALSVHAWGIAFDINASTNRFGERPTMDRRIVEIMKRWGFAWGGDFLIPDGMHFEFVRTPPGAQFAAADSGEPTTRAMHYGL